MAITVKLTQTFKNWLKALSDLDAKQEINVRIERARDGNFGKRKRIQDGEGVMEMIFEGPGPGYRVYYCQAGSQFYWVLVGGTKKTQAIDVDDAKALKRILLRRQK